MLDVVGAVDREASQLGDLPIGVATVAARGVEVRVHCTAGLDQRVVNLRAAHQAAAIRRDVLLIQRLGRGKHRCNQIVRSGAGLVDVDAGAHPVRIIRAQAGRQVGSQIAGGLTGAEGDDTRNALVVLTGQGLAQLLAVDAANVKVILRFIQVIEHGVSDEQIINLDDHLVLSHVPLALDHLAGGVIPSREAAGHRELSGLAVLNRAVLGHALEQAHPLKCRQDFTREDLEEQSIVFCPGAAIVIDNARPGQCCVRCSHLRLQCRRTVLGDPR